MRRATYTSLAPELVTHLLPMTGAAESFRVLRTNLQFMSLDRPLTTILVTSGLPGEGKSTVAANLAIAFAQTGAHVCLVDADLRRPRVDKLFSAQNGRGLTNLVAGQAALESALQSCPVPGLSLLTSGPIPPNPAELLGSLRMAGLLAELQERFDMVILDSPPTLAVTDAAVLAARVSGVLLVVRADRVARHEVRRAQASLEAVQARLLGVTLSAVGGAEHHDYDYKQYRSDTGGRSGRRRRPGQSSAL